MLLKFEFFNLVIYYKSLIDIILYKLINILSVNFLCIYRDFVEVEMFGFIVYDELGGLLD